MLPLTIVHSLHSQSTICNCICASTNYQRATNNVVLYGLPFQSYDPCQCNLNFFNCQMKNPLKKAHFEIFRLQNGGNKSRKADLQNGHFFTPVCSKGTNS